MQRNIKPGVFENVVGLSIGTFVLNEPTHIKLDGSYRFLMDNITVKQGALTVPPSSYVLATDTKATLQEVGRTDATLRAMITITNVTYVGVELNISGQNFGSYSSNDSNVDYVDKSITTLSNTVTPLLDALYLNGIPPYDPAEEYLAIVSFCQDEGMIWSSNFGTVGVPNVGNKPSVNQDKWYPVSAPTEYIDIGVGDSIPTTYRHLELTFDTSLGDLLKASPLTPSFEGQTISYGVNDTGLGELDFNGSYNLFVSLDSSLTKSLRGGIKGVNGEWIPFGGVTADYSSGTQKIKMSSNRNLFLQDDITTSGASSETRVVTMTHSISFATTKYQPNAVLDDRIGGTTFFNLGYATKTTNQTTFVFINTRSSSSVSGTAEALCISDGGDYA
jgi:hypothetical protein